MSTTLFGRVKYLVPFGVIVPASSPDVDPGKASGLLLRELLDHSPFVLLRGFRPLDKAEMERSW
jgi:hypothetical protein